MTTREESLRRAKRYALRRHSLGGRSTVDAGPYAAMLEAAAERMSYSAIARHLNTSHGWVTAVIRGQVRTIAPERAAQVLSLRDHQPVDHSWVTARGTRRRLQALHWLGYSWASLAAETTTDLSTIKDIAHGHTASVSAHRVVVITDVYEHLSMRLPVGDTPHKKAAITRARAASQTYGWLPPLAWDDIDTDQAPAVARLEGSWEDQIDHAMVRRVVDGGPRPRRLSRAEAQEVVDILLRRGLSTTQIEDDYGFRTNRYIGDRGQVAS